MRLFTTDGENPTGEIKTFDTMSSVYDAVKIAQEKQGDGTYWCDNGSGRYYEFTIADGQAGELTEEGWREGAPSDHYDNTALEERTRQPSSQFGGFFREEESAQSAEAPSGNEFSEGVE